MPFAPYPCEQKALLSHALRRSALYRRMSQMRLDKTRQTLFQSASISAQLIILHSSQCRLLQHWIRGTSVCLRRYCNGRVMVRSGPRIWHTAVERVELILMAETCADCKAVAPRWASVNLGIFICVNCASVHRKMGTHRSRVYVYCMLFSPASDSATSFEEGVCS